MSHRHLRLHRRDAHHKGDPLKGFGFIAHEVDVESDDMKRRDIEHEHVKRVVYVTASATFEGEIGGYSTVGKEVKPTKTTQASQASKETESAKSKKEKEEEEEEEKKKEEEEEEAEEKKKEEEEKKKEEEEKKKEEEEEKQKKEEEEKAKSRSKTQSKDDEDETATATAKLTKTTKERVLTTTTDASSIPSVITDPTDTESLESVLAKATGEASASTTIERVADLTGASAVSSSTSSETAAVSAEGGTSTGAKAGIAFGVLGGLLAVGLLVFFIFNRRRKQAEMQRLDQDDEKLNGPSGNGFNDGGFHGGVVESSAASRTDPKAPRISLRPVTQFLPNWNLEKRASKGAGMALAAPMAATPEEVTTSRAPGGSAWDRPTTAQSADPANPFGTQAERVPSPIHEESIQARSTSPNAVSPVDPSAVPASLQVPSAPPTPSTESLVSNAVATDGLVATAGVASGAAAGALLERKTSMRKDDSKNLDLTLPNAPLATVPASPSTSEFGVPSSAPGTQEAASVGSAAIAAAGGPANSSVHRVQLDFKPTLDDELGLNAGELVRLLHEYDDGWALCIRLDRSQQGVVPRTCLSARPVKPRPAQPGPRPGPRGPGPNQPQGQRPMTPQGQRPMGPQANFGQGRPASPAGRPMTPNDGRSQSAMGRPMAPGGPGGRPMSPGMRTQSPEPFRGPPGRSQSPGPRPGPPGARPMSPGPRSQSPGPRQGQPGSRPQSPNGMNRRNSPPGPSPMNPAQGPPAGPPGRKPVPGQAY